MSQKSTKWDTKNHPDEGAGGRVPKYTASTRPSAAGAAARSGQATQSALRAFQADMGMEQTGEVDDTVLARLRAQDQRDSER